MTEKDGGGGREEARADDTACACAGTREQEWCEGSGGRMQTGMSGRMEKGQGKGTRQRVLGQSSHRDGLYLTDGIQHTIHLPNHLVRLQGIRYRQLLEEKIALCVADVKCC